MPTAGGPDRQEATALLQAAAGRYWIVGCNVGLGSERDPAGRAGAMAARIVLTVLGLVLKQRMA